MRSFDMVGPLRRTANRPRVNRRPHRLQTSLTPYFDFSDTTTVTRLPQPYLLRLFGGADCICRARGVISGKLTGGVGVGPWDCPVCVEGTRETLISVG
jgi:hypothetical protein